MSSAPDGDAGSAGTASIDELLDLAVAAINRGDREAASVLAGQVLTVDSGNLDAEDLLAAPASGGEIRRLTILFVDLVDSTACARLSGPQTHALLVGQYRDLVLSSVNRYGGHIASTKGESLLAVFGYPKAHEDDVSRAVLAGLTLTRQLARLTQDTKGRFGIDFTARVGVHRGLVYLDTDQDDVYGLGANVAARVSGLAPPGTMVVSEAVAPLIRAGFELAECRPAAVKGIQELIVHHRVLGERATPARMARGPLVGRDREVADLGEAWAHAQAGTASTPGVVFRGEPGIGKSRLATSAAALAADSGAVTLELAGSSLHTQAGLHPIRTLLENRCGMNRLTAGGERLRLLQTEVAARGLNTDVIVPLLAPVLGIGVEAGYQPSAAEGAELYRLISQAVQDYLLACLGEGAGLVLAEDVHWFDSSSHEVLGALLSGAGGRLLVVITARPGGWLPPAWPVRVVDLKPLTADQTDLLISALNPVLSEHDRAAVAGRCDGVPFFVEQVVDGITETGVPEALYEPLLARLRASANVVPVVEAAALIGRELDRNLLCSVVELSDDAVDEVLSELEVARVLEPWGTGNWRFRHELLREVAEELAPPSVRRGLHARIADVLISGGSGQPDWPLVAAHYEQAEEREQAVSAHQRASIDAKRRGALDEARSYLTRALTQIDEQAPGPARDKREMVVRLERGFLITAAQGASGHSAAADFEWCLRVGGPDARDDEVFSTLLALAAYYFALGDLRRAGTVFDSLRGGLNDEREFLRPVIAACVGILDWLRGEFATARTQIEQATADFEAAGRPAIDAVWFAPADPIALAHGILALDGIVSGDLTRAEEQLALAARRAGELAFPQGPFSLAFAHFFEIWIRIERGQLDRAAALATDLVAHGDRHGFKVWQLWGAAQQAIAEALDSGSTAGVARVGTMVDAIRGAELTIYLTLFDAALGQLLTGVGRRDQARTQLDTGLGLARATGMSFYDAELLRLRAHTHRDPGRGRAELGRALELAGHQHAPLFGLRAALDDYAIRGEPARGALIEAADRVPAGSGCPELSRARAVLGDIA